MRVVWSPLAIERATEAAAYIAKDSPESARRWVDGLFAVVATLAHLPERGRRVPDLPRPDIRELRVGSYRVVYRIEAKRVAVLTVRHLRRRFDSEEIE
jgi:plasmid stabilization system protein ParE